MQLDQIAEINIGVVLKRKEALYKNDNTYFYNVFNLRNYDDNIPFDEFYSDEDLSEFTIKKGDLLFRLAYPLKIVEADDNLSGLIVSNQYCVIRINEDNKKINTDFIKWFLESDNAKQQFDKVLIGTTVKTIPVVKLRQLIIPNISKKKQEKLSKIINNWDEQRKLYQEIIKQKDKYYNSIINNEIHKESNNNE